MKQNRTTWKKRRDFKHIGRALAAITLVLSLSNLTAQTNNSSPEVQELRKQIERLERKVQALEHVNSTSNTAPSAEAIEDLDQKVRILERNRELEQETAEAKNKETARLTVGDRGVSFNSADTNFNFQLRGLLQIDSRTFFHDSGISGNDSFLLRRARPILQGTVYRDFDFLFVPDFGGTGSPQIFDAYVNYRCQPELQLRVGKFKTPVGLEQLIADKDTLFNERALPTALVPNRDLGAQIHGDLFQTRLSYAVGIFNGIGDARNSSNADIDDNKSVGARIFAQPFLKNSTAVLQGLGFGVAGSYENLQRTNSTALPATTGGTFPGYATPAGQQFFAYNPTNGVVLASGEHWRIAPQAAWTDGPFNLLGEYTVSEQQVRRFGSNPQSARLANTAWQIAAGWVLTGEDATFSGIVPRQPFNPREGHWGAVQLVARYSELNIDSGAFPLFSNPASSASKAQEYAIGVNWFLNRNIRVNASYSHIDFTGGGGGGNSAPAAVTRHNEDVYFTRFQLSF